LFGKEITFTYNKHHSYTTRFGGICSLVAAAIVLTFTCQKFYSVIRQDFDLTESMSYTDLSQNPVGFELTHEDYSVAVKLELRDGFIVQDVDMNRYF
jgi:hypothetical protein